MSDLEGGPSVFDRVQLSIVLAHVDVRESVWHPWVCYFLHPEAYSHPVCPWEAESGTLSEIDGYSPLQAEMELGAGLYIGSKATVYHDGLLNKRQEE